MSSLVFLTKYSQRLQSINNIKLFNITTRFSQLNHNLFGKRFLFTNQFLGIDKYVSDRKQNRVQFTNRKDAFFQRITEMTNTETKLIYSQDLKNYLFLVENNENDLNLMVKMIEKFNSQDESLRFGDFTFGPIVMRLCHYLGNSDLAVSLIKNPQLKQFFSQLNSITIALDLLYEHEKYEEVIDLFDYVQNNLNLHTKYPLNCILLLSASYYKINSPQSFEKAYDLLKKTQEVGAIVSRKSLCLFAALALNQNQTNIALEILSSISQTNYITVKHLRLCALSDIKRFDDVFSILNVMLSRSETGGNQISGEVVLKETFDRIKSAVNNNEDEEVKTQFIKIEKKLMERKSIEDTSLESLLTSPVTSFTKDMHRKNQGSGQNPVRQINQNYRTRASNSRPGLKDYLDME